MKEERKQREVDEGRRGQCAAVGSFRGLWVGTSSLGGQVFPVQEEVVRRDESGETHLSVLLLLPT